MRIIPSRLDCRNEDGHARGDINISGKPFPFTRMKRRESIEPARRRDVREFT